MHHVYLSLMAKKTVNAWTVYVLNSTAMYQVWAAHTAIHLCRKVLPQPKLRERSLPVPNGITATAGAGSSCSSLMVFRTQATVPASDVQEQLAATAYAEHVDVEIATTHGLQDYVTVLSPPTISICSWLQQHT